MDAQKRKKGFCHFQGSVKQNHEKYLVLIKLEVWNLKTSVTVVTSRFMSVEKRP